MQADHLDIESGGTASLDNDVDAVVCVNGLFQRAASWDPLVAILSPYCDVITYDLRNQGRQRGDYPRDQLDCHVQDLGALLDRNGLTRVNLVGHSYGARIALEFALSDRSRVGRLVLAGLASPELAPRYQMIFRSWRDALPQTDQSDWAPFAETISPWVFSARYLAAQPAFVRQYARYLAASHDRQGINANLNQLIASYDAENVARLRGSTADIPALILNGAEDYLTPPSTMDAAMRILPHSTLRIFAGCGHAVTAEAQREFESETLEFLLA
jgi:pimeloyl-ACP methyl ester carboxylesterase